MKIRKETFAGIAIIAVIALGVGGIYGFRKYRDRNSLAASIAELSPRGAPPETLEGLRQAIRLYEADLDRYEKTVAQTGVYWKILASRLQDRGMHGEALEALERGIYYNPEDPALHYMTGLSAGVMAKSSLNFQGTRENAEQARYYALSEAGYLRAISLDERYARPRYGLGVLYVFELNRPGEAVVHLERYLETQTRDVDAMFVLARAYYMVGRNREAMELYDRIMPLTKDPLKRAEAENNRQFILEGADG
jgi:tetratricopeptide (TPR) repeat protein